MADSNKKHLLSFLKNRFLVVAVIILALPIILPIPTIIFDILISANLAFALTVFFIALYTKKPTEFNLFPSLLLISSIFSLALNISSTRLILSQGQEFNSAIFNLFSNFIKGLSDSPIQRIIIGFIFFIIIIAVLVIFIIKSATIISGVAANFTFINSKAKEIFKRLEIKTKYNSGAITEEEYQKIITQVQKEFDFYDYLDGACKFISEYVKINVFIIIVEILVGFIIGYKTEDKVNIISSYISLAIIDGLIIQLHILIINTIMGIIIKKAIATDFLTERDNMHMFAILQNNTNFYWLCSAILAVLALSSLFFITGFPWPIVLLMSTLIGFHAYIHLIGFHAYIFQKSKTKIKNAKE